MTTSAKTCRSQAADPCHGLPRHRPAGRRPADPHHLGLARMADRFAGLPEGMTRWRLMAALRTAARSMRLTASMLALVEHYVDQTFDADWSAGGEPIVIRPLTDTAAALGLTERHVRNLETALAERGLLVWRDSGNHRRFGQRDPATGQLISGYGPSLAPMAMRAGEIIEAAARTRAGLQERRRLRAEIAALRRRLHAAYDALAEAGLSKPADPVPDLPRRVDARMSLEHIRTIVESLRQTTTATEERLLETAPQSHWRSDKTAMEEMACPPYDNARKETFRTTGSKTPTATITLKTVEQRAALLMKKTAEKLGAPETEDISDTAEHIRWHCGIDQQAWSRARRKMGVESTALCATLIGQRLKDQGKTPVIRDPSAYLEAMTRRHGQRRLDLVASIRAMIRREASTSGDGPSRPQLEVGEAAR